MHNGEASMTFTDTTPEAARRYWERVRATAPRDRLRRALKLSEQFRKLVMADIKKRNPGATERELAIAFVRRVYGDELADRFGAHQMQGR